MFVCDSSVVVVVVVDSFAADISVGDSSVGDSLVFLGDSSVGVAACKNSVFGFVAVFGTSVHLSFLYGICSMCVQDVGNSYKRLDLAEMGSFVVVDSDCFLASLFLVLLTGCVLRSLSILTFFLVFQFLELCLPFFLSCWSLFFL